MMPFRTILIHAGREQRFQAQLAVGIDLAARFQSHLVGLAILPPVVEIPVGVPGAPGTVTVDRHRKAFAEEAQRMHASLRAAADARTLSCEWLVQDSTHTSNATLLIDNAQTADLVICGPPEQGIAGRLKSASATTERVILGAGRPVLIVPRSPATPTPVGNRILVAWNGTREATRAVFDALPLLKTAHHVKVLSIGQGGGRGAPDLRAPEHLCRILARHDVRARAEVISLPGADVGTALLSWVKAENADLLVMGCYGHPRLYEYALGGASYHVLHEASVPVLTSH